MPRFVNTDSTSPRRSPYSRKKNEESSSSPPSNDDDNHRRGELKPTNLFSNSASSSSSSSSNTTATTTAATPTSRTTDTSNFNNTLKPKDDDDDIDTIFDFKGDINTILPPCIITSNIQNNDKRNNNNNNQKIPIKKQIKKVHFAPTVLSKNREDKVSRRGTPRMIRKRKSTPVKNNNKKQIVVGTVTAAAAAAASGRGGVKGKRGPTFRKEVTVRQSDSNKKRKQSTPRPATPTQQHTSEPSNISPDNSSMDDITTNNNHITSTTSTSSSNDVTPSKPPRPSWIPSRGLAIDTRTVQTFDGNAVGQMLVRHTSQFLELTRSRGLPPTLVASTILDPTKNNSSGSGGGTNANRVFMKVQATKYPQHHSCTTTTTTCTRAGMVMNQDMSIASTSEKNSDESLFPIVSMPFSSPISGITSNDTLSTTTRTTTTSGKTNVVPKNLLACDSWRTFGDLVNNMVSEYKSSNQDGNNNNLSTNHLKSASSTQPLSITILTHDVALFTDENMDSHKRGMTRFWDRMRGFFQSNVIRSIHLILFETGAIISPPNTNLNGGNSSLVSNVDGDDSTSTNNNRQGSSSLSSSSNMEYSQEMTCMDESTNSRHSHQLKIAQFTQMIRNHLTKLSDKEYKNSMILVESPSSSSSSPHHGQPMNIQLDRVDFNSISYQSLLRQWMNDIMGPASGGSGRISFELPETMDGTQCSVVLDLSYTILPHRFDSPLTHGLITDMKLLSQASYLEVMQLISLTSVDLSLVYGVNMTAKAGLVDDLNQYREMQKLVVTLYEYLQSKDIAIVLRGTTNEKKAVEICGKEVTGGYHTHTQYFLLMADEEDDCNRGSRQRNADSISSGYEDDSIETSTNHRRRKCDPSTCAMKLFRYTCMPDYILQLSKEDNRGSTSFIEDDQGQGSMDQIYAEYVSDSLDCLETIGINPFLTGQ